MRAKTREARKRQLAGYAKAVGFNQDRNKKGGIKAASARVKVTMPNVSALSLAEIEAKYGK